VITATILAGVFFLAVLVSILALIKVGMNREHSRHLSTQAPTRLAGATRAIAGLHVRMPGRDVQVLSPADPDDPCAEAPATSRTPGPRPGKGATS
jgi:hypothetical protein